MLTLARMCTSGNIDTAQAPIYLPVTLLSPRRYYRLPLPVEGAPLEEDFDAFVNMLRVSWCKNVNHASGPPFREPFFGWALLDGLLF